MIKTFVENPVNFEEIEKSDENVLYETLKNKGVNYVLKNENKLLNNIFNELWNNEAYRKGIKKLKGWLFDYSEFMNIYWVKTTDGIEEIKSFNNDFIIKNSIHPNKILKIVRVDGIGLTYQTYPSLKSNF